jgi:hypothetical protein
MIVSNRHPPHEEQVEYEVLAEIICLHPIRLTLSELVLRVAGKWGGSESVAIEDSIQALKRSGLVRQTGDVLEPTYAALRAAELFRWA